MIPELGYFALIIAFSFALILSGIAWLPASQHSYVISAARARRITYGQCTFVLFAYVILTLAFLQNDFSVEYVALHSNTHLPWYYRMTAVWGAHEGSMLLWLMLLTLWSAAVAYRMRFDDPQAQTIRLAILGVVSVGFTAFILWTSNPFLRLLPQFPAEGQDLNPLLQDIGLIIHPPMLYMGYVGFTIVFAFTMTPLFLKQFTSITARQIKPWALAAWCFLTGGIILGSWWSYRELGWGGWWAWDPVENASLLPWLIGTALIHSLIVNERRALFFNASILLAIIAFSLSLLGTFLVRSGILISVHAFASDPTRGIYMLTFLCVITGSALFFYALRHRWFTPTGRFELFSKETMILANTILLCVMMITILLGTLYPLIADAAHVGKISVGAPYFNTVILPLSIPLLLLLAIAPYLSWQRDTFKKHAPMLLSNILLSGFIVFLIAIAHPLQISTVIGIFAANWILLLTVRFAYRHRENSKQLKQALPMLLAHGGIGILILGIALSVQLSSHREVRMQLNDTVSLNPYTFQLTQLRSLAGPNYQGMDAEFSVFDQTRPVTTIHAQKRRYDAQQAVMTEAGIDANPWRDLYISLGTPFDDDSWSVYFYDKPFIRWIWLGGLITMLGGLAAILLRRNPHEKT